MGGERRKIDFAEALFTSKNPLSPRFDNQPAASAVLLVAFFVVVLLMDLRLDASSSIGANSM